jgi:hypothetical protein
MHAPADRQGCASGRTCVAEFAYGSLTDDLCLLAARIA